MSVVSLVPRRARHHATTRMLAGTLPLCQDTPIGRTGCAIGRSWTGAPFSFDPWLLYDQHDETTGQRLLPAASTLIVATKGSGKSSLIKSYLLRQCGVFGRRAVVISPKPGEYDRLARALGHAPIALHPGSGASLNVLDAHTHEDRVRAAQVVSASVLRRELGPSEAAALSATIRVLAEDATLERLVGLLAEPPVEAWGERWASLEEWRAETRDLMLQLDLLRAGTAGGVFSTGTSPQIRRALADAPVCVFDVSRIADDKLVVVAMSAIATWLRNQLAQNRGGEKWILALDEAWRVISHEQAAASLVDLVKHSRAWGLQPILASQLLSDFPAAGNTGSRVSQLADNLISDADVVILGHQPASEARIARERFGLSHAAADELSRLQAGEALWVLGGHQLLVSHEIPTSFEWDVCQTDDAMTSGGT